MRDNFLLEEIKFCNNADKIIIGISGGADSVALTHILFSRLPADKLICAHVNHGIRGEEADRDENFVREFSESLGIRFEVLHADIPALSKEWHMGEEECGRKVRYDFFANLAKGENDIIVTAHNADDNTETVLMNLIKGAGLKGLSGIPKKRDKVYRPILSMTRAEIETYCRDNDLSYVTDSTNLETDYDRNKLRLKVIPVLKEINPALISAVTRSASIVAEADEFLNEQAEELLISAEIPAGLDAAALKTAPEIVFRTAIKAYLENKGCGRLEKKHLDAIAGVLANSGAVSLPGNILFTVKQNILTVTEDVKAEGFNLELYEGDNSLPDGRILRMELFGEEFSKNTEKIHNLLFYNYCDYDKIISGPVAGCRREGDRFTLQKRKITKPLKKLLNELKIPAALRDKLIVIRDGDELIFVEGVGISEKYKADKNTVHAVKFSVLPGKNSDERIG